MPPDRIELNIPKIYHQRGLGEIPREVYPTGCDVFRVEKDLGPATKILPTLERYRGTDTRIVYCDDDWIFQPDWLGRLLNWSNKHPNCVIADRVTQSARHEHRSSWRPRKPMYKALRSLSLGLWNPKSKFVNDVAEGCGGVLIKPDFIGAPPHIPKEHWPVDDVWLSGLYHANGHPVVWTGKPRDSADMEIWVDGTKLREKNSLFDVETNGQKRLNQNVECIRYMRSKYGVFKS